MAKKTSPSPKTSVPRQTVPSAKAVLEPRNALPLPPAHWRALILLLLPLLVYGRTVGFDFSWHDDERMIADNVAALSRGFDWGMIFGTDAWFMPRTIELYRPWQSLTYVVDYQIGGSAPWIFHLHNVLLFSLNALLLNRWLAMLLGDARLAFYGALVYAVHFLFVHAVCWIPARGDLYLFFFGVSSLLALYRYLRSGQAGWLLANAGLTFLAMLSKESGVVLPAVAAVVLYLHRSELRQKGPIALWALLVLGFSALYFYLRGQAIYSVSNLTFGAFLGNLRTIPEEVAKFFLPLGFSVMPAFSTLLTACGLAAIGGLFFFFWKNKNKIDPKIFWPGMALFVFSLAPSLFYAPSFAGMAYDYLDHRAYFVFLGLWAMLLAGAKALRFTEKKWAALLAFGLIGYGVAGSLWFSGAYQDKWHYYSNALSTNPRSGLANLNYGIFLRREEKINEALPYFEKAVAASPNYYDSHVRLAEAYDLLGRPEDAVRTVNEAIRLNPNSADAYNVRGSALGKQGQHAAALPDFERAAALSPQAANLQYNLGLALRNTSRREEAILAFERAVKLNPNYADAWYELGFNAGVLNRFEQAKQALDRAVQLNPRNANAWLFRGLAHNSLGNRPAACDDWNQALRLGKQEANVFLGQNCQ